jgi:hypothetical protein
MEQEDFEELNRKNVSKSDLLFLHSIKNRKLEYPPIEDFADAWVKQDEVALEEYRQNCLAVKAKYPKPI